MPKNIFAYTAPGGAFPEYLSINAQADGSITIDVRSPPTFDVMQSGEPMAVCGPHARITVSADRFDELARDLKIAANNIRIMGKA